MAKDDQHQGEIKMGKAWNVEMSFNRSQQVWERAMNFTDLSLGM